MSPRIPSLRSRYRNTIATAVLAAVLAGAACTAESGGETGGEGTDVAGNWQESIDWEPCGDGEDAECGTLTVPIDWDEPEGETVDLALSRLTAGEPGERIGSLLYFAGGPGDPGAIHVRFTPELFSEQVRDRFDVIGIDPRGVNDSEAVTCSQDVLEAEPDPYLRSQEDFDERVEYNRELREDCRGSTGALYDHLDTLNVVHDTDAIRSAVGEDQLTAYGTSYGSVVGALYAEQYSDRVRALALDSVSDHNLQGEEFVGMRVESMQAAFDAFVDWCAGEEQCDPVGDDVPTVWADVLDRADEGDLDGPDGPLTSYDIVEQASGCAYGPDWPGLASYLAALDSGQVPDGPACGGGEEEEDTPPVELADPAGLQKANFCSDYDLPVADYEEWRTLMEDAGEEYGPDVRMSPNAVQRVADCLGGHHPVTNPQHDLEVTGEAQMLLVNPVADPITGHNQAVSVAEQAGRWASLVTYEGAGHGAYGFFSGSDCVTEIVDDYLITASLPEDGTTCPAVPGNSGTY